MPEVIAEVELVESEGNDEGGEIGGHARERTDHSYAIPWSTK